MNFKLIKLTVPCNKPWFLIVSGKDSKRFKTWTDAWASVTARVCGDGQPQVYDASLFDVESRHRTKLNRKLFDAGHIDLATFYHNNKTEYERRQAYFVSIGALR